MTAKPIITTIDALLSPTAEQDTPAGSIVQVIGVGRGYSQVKDPGNNFDFLAAYLQSIETGRMIQLVAVGQPKDLCVQGSMLRASGETGKPLTVSGTYYPYAPATDKPAIQVENISF